MYGAMRRGAVVWLWGALNLAGLACAPALDTEVGAGPERSVGEEVFRIVCLRLAGRTWPEDVTAERARSACDGRTAIDWTDAPRLGAWLSPRDELIASLDAMLPEEAQDELAAWLDAATQTYENEADHFPLTVRALARSLQRAATDDELVATLARWRLRAGYRPEATAQAPIAGFLGTDALRSTLHHALEAYAASPSRRHRTELIQAQLAEGLWSPEAGRRWREWLLAEGTVPADHEPTWAVARDERGLAMIADTDGLSDRDFDGRPDVDSFGRYLGSDGEPLALPLPFEGERRPETDGALVYRYRDAARTVVGAGARLLAHSEAGSDALDVSTYLSEEWLGPKVPRTRRVGAETVAYEAHDLAQAGWWRTTEVLAQVLAEDVSVDAVEALRQVAERSPQAMAGMVHSLRYALRRFHTEADIDEGLARQFRDDALTWLMWVADAPGLLDGLLRGLADPRSARLGDVLGEMMRYRDQVPYNREDRNEIVASQTWTRLVDRTGPQTQANRSLFSRSIALIHDLGQQSVCNRDGARVGVTVLGRYIPLPGRYDECALIELPDMIETYLRAILGRAELQIKPDFINTLTDAAALLGIESLTIDELLQRESDIDGFTSEPTAFAMNRFVFTPQTRFLEEIADPLRTRDGALVSERHAGTIFAWERAFEFDDGYTPKRIGFLGAFTPVVDAFDRLDPRVVGSSLVPSARSRHRRILFSEMISLLHLYWPPEDAEFTQARDEAAPFFAYSAGIARWEPALADVLQEGELMRNIARFLTALRAVEVRPGVDGISAISRWVARMANPRETPELLTLDGERRVRLTNGRTVGPTHLNNLFESLDRWPEASPTDALPGRPEEGVFGVEHRPDGPHFRQPAVATLMTGLLGQLAEAGHAANLAASFDAFRQDLLLLLASPAGAALLDWAKQLDHGALRSLVDAFASPALSRELARSATDWADLLADTGSIRALRKFGGLATEPSLATADGAQSLLELAISFGVEALADSRTDAFLHLLARGWAPPSAPLIPVWDALAEVGRARPMSVAPFDADDYRHWLLETAAFLEDEDNGLRRFFRIVAERQRP